MPEATDGVTLDREAVDGDVAVARDADVTIRVFGFWAGRGSQNLYVTYRNAGPLPLRVDTSRFALAGPGGRAALARARDVSGRVRSDGTVDEADAPVLFEDGTARALVVQPGGSGVASVNFAPLQPPLAVGDSVDVTLPSGQGTVSIRFRAAGGAG